MTVTIPWRARMCPQCGRFLDDPDECQNKQGVGALHVEEMLTRRED